MPESTIYCIPLRGSLFAIALTAVCFHMLSVAGAEAPPVISIRLEEEEPGSDHRFL